MVGEESLRDVKIFLCAFDFKYLKMYKPCFIGNDEKLLGLDNCHWEMLLKAFGQPLGTAKTVQEIRWEMHKGYWIASGQFLESIGKPLGNAHIPAFSQYERR